MSEYREAKCHRCKRVFCVKKDGTIWKHRGSRIGEYWCDGSGRKVLPRLDRGGWKW